MNLLSTIIATLCGSGIGGFLMWVWNYSNNKRIANAEADKAEIEASDASVNTMSTVLQGMESAMSVMRAQLDALKDERDTYAQRLDEALRRIDVLLRRNEAAEHYACIHVGCAVRHPALGMGGRYYEAHCDDGCLEDDTTDIITLCKDAGLIKDL